MRFAPALTFALAFPLLLAGCTADAGSPPTPTPESVETPAGPEPIESLDDLAGTRWIGTDSEGDQITFRFEPDGQLGFTSYGERYEHEEDRWWVEGERVIWDATFGGPYGTCRYTGDFDVSAQVISALSVCSTGVPDVTVDLRQPAR